MDQETPQHESICAGEMAGRLEDRHPHDLDSQRYTRHHITLEQKDGSFAITESHLQLKAKVSGATQEAFDKASSAAKSGCPVSKLFNTTITLEAQLRG